MTFSFETALAELKDGAAVCRDGWNGKGMYIALTIPDGFPINLPFIYIKTAAGHRIPWVASQTDLLADDWMVRDEIRSEQHAHTFGGMLSGDHTHYSLRCQVETCGIIMTITAHGKAFEVTYKDRHGVPLHLGGTPSR